MTEKILLFYASNINRGYRYSLFFYVKLRKNQTVIFFNCMC